MAVISSSYQILSFLTIIAYFRFCYGESISASFVFGDSLLDSGNNNYINTLSRANYEPNGIDFLPTREATGRFTNGRTVSDIIGEELGLPNYAPPYLAPSTTGPIILNGVNYASGAGGILNKTGATFIGRLNLDAQIDYYANTRQDIISMLGMPAASSLLRRSSLFTVNMGSNDFTNNYLIPVLSAPERALVSPEMFIDGMISKYRKQLTRLYNLDARKILVVNVGPIGCIPYERDSNPKAGDNCVAFPNQLAQRFNEKLKGLLNELRSSLEDSLFVYGDVYGIITNILQNYKSYGFEVPDIGCCYLAGRHGGLIPCTPPSHVCPDRSKYFFWDPWDPYHPTDAANVFISKRLFDGDLNDIFPLNVRQLTQA